MITIASVRALHDRIRRGDPSGLKPTTIAKLQATPFWQAWAEAADRRDSAASPK